MTRYVVLVSVCVCVFGGHVLADAPDLSSPRATLKSLWAAVVAGDVDAVAETMHVENDAQRELVRATAEMLVAGERLKRAARERFGEAGDAMGRRMIEADELAAALEKPDPHPNEAAVTIEGAQKRFTFRQSQDGWRLVVIGPEGGRPVATPAHVALVRASAGAIEQMVEEIREGNHATAEAATAAVEQKLHAVMLEAHRRSTTRPATWPATRPAGS